MNDEKEAKNYSYFFPLIGYLCLLLQEVNLIFHFLKHRNFFPMLLLLFAGCCFFMAAAKKKLSHQTPVSL